MAAKGKIVNTTLQGRHSLMRTRGKYLVKVPAGGATKDPGTPGPGIKGRAVARGAGSINCESEINQLIDARDTAAAVKLYAAHHRIRGVPKLTRLARWYQQATG